MTDKQYRQWLTELKQKVRTTQLKAAVSVNRELLRFYWDLGYDIIEKQKQSHWGSGFLVQLSRDLHAEFPDLKGFSESNLHFIRRWVSFYISGTDNSVTACDRIGKSLCPNSIIEIPWGHNRVIVTKCATVPEALYYATNTVRNNWSRSVLTHQIASGLWRREGKAITNFDSTLPQPQSDLANQLLKDPYAFDFLTMTDAFNERELELGLVGHLSNFLLELGAGFAYLGKQIPIRVGGKRSR